MRSKAKRRSWGQVLFCHITRRKQRVHKSLAQHERAAIDRDSAIRAAYANGAYTLKAIGEYFGLHYATVRRIARAVMWQNKI